MLEIRGIAPDRLAEYARIPIVFEVTTEYRVEELDLGFRLVEARPGAEPKCSV